MERNSGAVSLDVNEIARSLKTSSETLEPLSANCCIYKVLPHFYNIDKEAYTPKLVSIGPYHHGKPELQSMETHKLRYLNAFLERTNITMEEYIDGVKELEIRLRESYVEIDGYNREKFIEIMAVDGAFLMQFLDVITAKTPDRTLKDRVIGRQQMFLDVFFDMLLLENQLPFFYLEYLFSLLKKSNSIAEGVTLIEKLQGLLFPVTGWTTNTATTETPAHLLHLVMIPLHPLQRQERKELRRLLPPTISELHQAGVKFKRSSTNCFSFANGTLEIPMLRITQHTNQKLRNMQAFEHCHLLDRKVGEFICLVDSLIDSAEDVKELVKNGIIDNRVGDNQAAATVITNLGKGNYNDINDFTYTQVVEKLNAYYNTRWHRWKATLKQKYFNSPWTIISVVAAGVLLILTVVQTACSILTLDS